MVESYISLIDVPLPMRVLNSNNIIYVCFIDVQLIDPNVIAYMPILIYMSEIKD